MAADARRQVTLFGLEVTDDAGYARYREAMAPILARHGGAFGCDFVVARGAARAEPAHQPRVHARVPGSRKPRPVLRGRGISRGAKAVVRAVGRYGPQRWRRVG